VPQSIVVHRH
jgi:hypothetical protein